MNIKEEFQTMKIPKQNLATRNSISGKTITSNFVKTLGINDSKDTIFEIYKSQFAPKIK